MENLSVYKIRLNRGGVVLFYFMTFIIVLGNVLDIHRLVRQDVTINYLNLPNIAIALVIFYLFYKKQLTLQRAYLFSITILYLNFIVSRYVATYDQLISEAVMRDTVFMCMIIAISSMFTYRWYSLVLAFAYILHIIFLAFIHNNHFLLDNLFIVATVIIAWAVALNYFFKIMLKVMDEIDTSRVALQLQLEKTSEINKKLEEHKYNLLQQQEETERSNELLLEANEELKQAKEELEKSNNTKDKLFEIVAHDIRSPMSAIAGLSEILFHDGHKISDDKRAKFISSIHSATSKLTSLLENLLYWARAQQKQNSINAEFFPLKDLVLEAVELFKSNLESKAITMKMDISESYIVYADYNMIYVVLRNLISNAIKFTARGGSLIIVINERMHMVHFELRDSGVGVADDKIPHLFSSTLLSSDRGTEGEKGTGIGLSLCKQFVDLNNGEIGVTSSLGKGSVFWFSLPRKK